MTTWLTSRKTQLGAALALAAGMGLGLMVLGQARAETTASATQKRVIGVAASNGFRAKITALRVPENGSAPDTATVKIAAFKSSHGSWVRLGRPLVVGQPAGWFWNVVTRPYGVRLLALSRPGGDFPSRITVKLLVSPSIGPSAAFRFVIDGGRLVQVDV